MGAKDQGMAASTVSDEDADDLDLDDALELDLPPMDGLSEDDEPTELVVDDEGESDGEQVSLGLDEPLGGDEVFDPHEWLKADEEAEDTRWIVDSEGVEDLADSEGDEPDDTQEDGWTQDNEGHDDERWLEDYFDGDDGRQEPPDTGEEGVDDAFVKPSSADAQDDDSVDLPPLDDGSDDDEGVDDDFGADDGLSHGPSAL